MSTGNMPGFTAERSLQRHQGRYSQRLMKRPVNNAADVRPQFFIDLLQEALGTCCIDGDLSCCRSLGHLLAARFS
jgi:hypothetical protein